ncbi:putative lipid II flippase FtsW [Dermabacteraceae bacterium TAE3-ERU27]|nr:putative lipid II flippase FtsW [Dermabacteraceae bacterium TAE3-ERU27]
MTRKPQRVVKREGGRAENGFLNRVGSAVGPWLKSPVLDFYGILTVGVLLIVFGIVMVLSSSFVLDVAGGGSGYGRAIKHFLLVLIGLVLMTIAAVLPPGFYRKIAPLALLAGLGLQTLVIFIGKEINGNRNWLQFGGQSFQPSEMLKLALIVWMALALSNRQPSLHRIKAIMPAVLPAIIGLGAVLIGKDLGTGLVLVALIGTCLWVAGVPRRILAGPAFFGVLAVLGLTFGTSNRRERISHWLSGYQCSAEGCYQPRHGLMGLAEGGWFGVGLGESRQKWGLLPHPDNDYIFAIIGEEIGLLGTLLVVFLYVALLFLLTNMVRRYKGDVFTQVATAGVAAWFLSQALINMCVVAGVLPVIGVPLPFISAGGTALTVSMGALGMLLSFARNEPGAKQAIQASWKSARGSVGVFASGTGGKKSTPGNAKPARGSKTRAPKAKKNLGNGAKGRKPRA